MADPDTLHFLKLASGETEDVTQEELETVADWSATGSIEYSGTQTGRWKTSDISALNPPKYTPRHPATTIGE